MAAVSKERLLQPARLRRKKIMLPPEYGDNCEPPYVWLQALSALDLMELKHRFGATVNIEFPEFRAHILRLSLINEDGSPMFARAKDTGLPEEEAHQKADDEVRAFLGSEFGLYQLLVGEAMEMSRIMQLFTPEGEPKN